MKADTASENQTEISTMEGHQSQNRRKRKISGTCYDPGMDLFFLPQPFGITETGLGGCFISPWCFFMIGFFTVWTFVLAVWKPIRRIVVNKVVNG